MDNRLFYRGFLCFVDLNNDNNIDILDIILMMGIIIDNSDYNPIAVFNSDRVIDVIDIVQIISMILD